MNLIFVEITKGQVIMLGLFLISIQLVSLYPALAPCNDNIAMNSETNDQNAKAIF